MSCKLLSREFTNGSIHALSPTPNNMRASPINKAEEVDPISKTEPATGEEELRVQKKKPKLSLKR